MLKNFIALGGLSAALAVILGAFGAHALKTKLEPSMLEVYQTAVHYHLAHSLGLVLIGIAALGLGSGGLMRASGWVMLVGILLFSGSLYALTLTGQRWLGAITPFGGIAFIVAWILLAVAALRHG